MSDLQKRLQEQNAANQKALAYKQANAKAVRAAQKQKAKRPDQPAEEKKGKKPVAAVDDAVGFRFFFTSDFYDLTNYDKSISPLNGILSGYQYVTSRYGDGWPTGVVQLNRLPPHMERAGFQLGVLNDIDTNQDHLIGEDPDKWRLSTLDDVSADLFPQIQEAPFADLTFSSVSPFVLETFSGPDPNGPALLDGFEADLSSVVEEGNCVIAFQGVTYWDVPQWPINSNDPFAPGVPNPEREFWAERYLPHFDLEYISDSLVGGERVVNLSYAGPPAKLHSFEAAVVRTCRQASDEGAIVLLSTNKQPWDTVAAGRNSYDLQVGLPGYFQGVSGISQGLNNLADDLLAYGVNVLDVTFDPFDRENSFGSLRFYYPERLQRTVDFINSQYTVAKQIERSYQGARFVGIVQHAQGGLLPIEAIPEWGWRTNAPRFPGKPFSLARNNRIRTIGGPTFTSWYSNPYSALGAFLDVLYETRSGVQSDFRKLQISRSRQDMLDAGFSSDAIQKAEEIDLIIHKVRAEAYNSFLGSGSGPVNRGQLELD